MGSTHSIEILINHNISIKAEYIPGTHNTLGDYYSRTRAITNDYSLCLSGFQLLISALPFYPEVDLFATRLTNKLPKYISWKPDPYAWKIYAFLSVA